MVQGRSRQTARGPRGDQTPREAYPYLLDTCIGSLEIAPDTNWVACCWVDIDHAKRIIHDDRLNPYSGKWNHHYTADMFASRTSAQAAADDFCSELSVFLPPNGLVTLRRYLAPA